MRRLVLELIVLSFLVLTTTTLGPAVAQHRPSQRHWEETKTETLWRGRYKNCKYSYYVVLPGGVIAHGSHSPAPNHGFMISLPDVGKTSEASLDEQRFLWVNAEYNIFGFSSLRALAKHRLSLSLDRLAEQHPRVLQRLPTMLDGLTAIQFRIDSGSATGRTIEEEIVALRSGTDSVVYEVGLHSTQTDYDHDKHWFEQIRKSFRLDDFADWGVQQRLNGAIRVSANISTRSEIRRLSRQPPG